MRKKRELEIREIESCEHAVCAAIYTNAWNGALPSVQRTINVAEFESETEGELTLVGILNKQIVGYVSIWERDWFIHHLYVDPLAQGIGIGGALVSYAEELASPQQLGLKCQLANIVAIGFYKSLGFTESTDTGTDEYGTWVRLEKNLA